MKKTVAVGPGGAYGLGIGSIGVRCGRPWGHGGGILDYTTLAIASEKGDRVGVVSIYGRPARSAAGRERTRLPDYRLAASAATRSTSPFVTRRRHLRDERRRQRTTAARSRQRPRLVARRTEDGVRQQGRHLRHERRRQRAAEACARQRSCVVTQRSEDRLPQGRAIYAMKADGSGLRRLVSGSDPAWSPDGQRIAFVRGSGNRAEIYLVNAGGDRQRKRRARERPGLVARRAEDRLRKEDRLSQWA